MREDSASLLVGTLADRVLDDLAAGGASDRGRDAAERLEGLLALAVGYRTGSLSEEDADPDVSATAAHTLLGTAAMRLGKLREGIGGLTDYGLALQAFREERLTGPARTELVDFLETLASWSARAGHLPVTALFPERNDPRRRAWIRR